MTTPVRIRHRPRGHAASLPNPTNALSLAVRYRPVTALRPAARNVRRHSPRQLTQIAASIREFGFVNPILVDAEGGVVAGHGRLEAAKTLKLAEVPTVCLEHLWRSAAWSMPSRTARTGMTPPSSSSKTTRRMAPTTSMRIVPSHSS